MGRSAVSLYALLLTTQLDVAAPNGTLLAAAARRGLVVGGENEQQRPHPFVVSLQNRGVHFCGGTLIDQQHVLTAAHCEEHVKCTGEICEGVSANVFRWNLSIPAAEEFPGCSIEIRGEKWVSHPQYTGEGMYSHDIAVLKLERPVPPVSACLAYGLRADDNVAAVQTQFGWLVSWQQKIHIITGAMNLSVYTAQDNGVRRVFAGCQLQAVGWGRLWEGGPQSPVLQEVLVDAILYNECQRAWRGVDSTQICAYGGAQRTRDICHGDSGGPLMLPGTNMQVGISSFSHSGAGSGCGDPSWPAVYTIPGNRDHQDWITRTVNCLSSSRCCPYEEFSDGIVSDAEMCDDGNTNPNDGCFCGQLEDGYTCSAESPSQCVPCGSSSAEPNIAAPCHDADDRCTAWSRRGECNANPTYMNANCRAACNVNGCASFDAGPSPAMYLHLILGPGQVEDDFSWKVWQQSDRSVRNTGTGSGYLICALDVEDYELEVIANRWNSSLGFTVSDQLQANVVLQQQNWNGRSITVAFNLAGAIALDPDDVE
eukprot:SAG11_NODE_3134_length_2663_cov_2.915367_1_plen_538_part_01